MKKNQMWIYDLLPLNTSCECNVFQVSDTAIVFSCEILRNLIRPVTWNLLVIFKAENACHVRYPLKGTGLPISIRELGYSHKVIYSHLLLTLMSNT